MSGRSCDSEMEASWSRTKQSCDCTSQCTPFQFWSREISYCALGIGTEESLRTTSEVNVAAVNESIRKSEWCVAHRVVLER